MAISLRLILKKNPLQTEVSVLFSNKIKMEARYMFGDGTVGHMTVDELQALERHLEIWMYQIRSAKVYQSFCFLVFQPSHTLEIQLTSAPTNHDPDPLYQMQTMFQEIQLLKNKVSLAYKTSHNLAYSDNIQFEF